MPGARSGGKRRPRGQPGASCCMSKRGAVEASSRAAMEPCQPLERGASSKAPVNAMTSEQQQALAEFDRNDQAASELTKRVIALLSNRKFVELDALAKEFRETNAEFPDSLRKLYVLYR